MLPGLTIWRGMLFTEPDQLLQRSVLSNRCSFFQLISDKTLPITAVSGNFFLDSAIGNQQQVREAFAQFTSFAVAHEHRVTRAQWYLSRVPDRCLHLTRSLEWHEPCATREVRLRLFFGANRPGGNVSTSKTRVERTSWMSHNLDGESGGRLVAKCTVIVEQRWSIES